MRVDSLEEARCRRLAVLADHALLLVGRKPRGPPRARGASAHEKCHELETTDNEQLDLFAESEAPLREQRHLNAAPTLFDTERRDLPPVCWSL